MSREPRNLESCGGFSLLEVVVAFAILALVLGVLYQIFSSAARRAVLVQEYHRAVLLVDSKLSEIGAQTSFTTGTTEGRFDEQYRWRSRIEPSSLQLGSTDRLPQLVPYRVTVEVVWGKSERQRWVAVTTVRLGPRG